VQHILTQKNEENSFPPLQKRIILYLAQNRPQTINQTRKGIKGHYKSTWTAFNALKKKGLVESITSKHYRGRQYPCFWVTELGLYLALCEGIKSESLLKTTLEIYPDNKNLQFLIEAVPILGKNAFDVLHLAVSNKGVIEQRQLISIFDNQKELTPKQRTQFIRVLKKYPELYQQCVNCVNQIHKNLKELSDLL